MPNITVSLRKCEITDSADTASALNNKKVLDNLRDGVPLPARGPMRFSLTLTIPYLSAAGSK